LLSILVSALASVLVPGLLSILVSALASVFLASVFLASVFAAGSASVLALEYSATGAGTGFGCSATLGGVYLVLAVLVGVGWVLSGSHLSSRATGAGTWACCDEAV